MQTNIYNYSINNETIDNDIGHDNDFLSLLTLLIFVDVTCYCCRY